MIQAELPNSRYEAEAAALGLGFHHRPPRGRGARAWPGQAIAGEERGWRPFLQEQHMGVSRNRGTPKIFKWMVYNGKPYWNGWFGGTTIFGNIHINPRDSNHDQTWFLWLEVVTFSPHHPKKEVSRFIARKMNGWNLRIHHWNRNYQLQNSKPSFSGSMKNLWGCIAIILSILISKIRKV